MALVGSFSEYEELALWMSAVHARGYFASEHVLAGHAGVGYLR